jgi:hypothetical protein
MRKGAKVAENVLSKRDLFEVAKDACGRLANPIPNA